MILWIIKWIFISTLLISLIHYLYSFFENILSVPKMKDLVKPHRIDEPSPSQFPPPPHNHPPHPPLPIDVQILSADNALNKNMEIELEEFLQDITKQKTI